jgi:hypothetical protein
VNPLDLILSKLPDAKQGTNGSWSARCPAHDDRHPSLSISATSEGVVLLKCHAECATYEVCKALGMQLSDLFPPQFADGKRGSGMNVVATYAYTDPDGQKLFEVVRLYPKAFRVRRPNPNAKDGWTWGPIGVKLVVYRLPEVIKAVAEGRVVYVVEDEKDADNLARHGLVATTNPGGARKWRKGYSEVLRGADVVILPDNDDDGRDHAEMVARSLSGLAKSVKVVTLPDLPEEGGVSDWLAAGGSAAQLQEMAAGLPDRKLTTPTAKGDGNTTSINSSTTDDPAAVTNTDRGEEKKVRQSVASQLVDLAAGTGVELLHTPDKVGYARVVVGGHRETLSLKSAAFKQWLAGVYYQATGCAAGAQAVQDAVNVLECQARFEGSEKAVHVRLAEHQGDVYLDLGDADWTAVRVTPAGWQLVNDPPVIFRRPRGLLALPVPVRGGTVDELRRFVNVPDDDGWRLLVVWMVAALLPTGPYPVLCLHGEQGSAKSSFARAVRWLLDASKSPLRSEPREARDLMIAANNSWVIALDNLSYLPPWLSDCLCRLATGGGFTTRELYSDAEEVFFDATRPCILTGIEEVATRGDLLERAIVLQLPAIPEAKRQTEEDYYADLGAAASRILGALLDTLAGVLGTKATVKLARLPRMADFAKVGAAVELTLGWPSGSFMAAYAGNQEASNELALDSPVVPLITRLADEGGWPRDGQTGTWAELLQVLERMADEQTKKLKAWPKRPQALSGQLRRLAPYLRRVGVQVEWGRRSGGNRDRYVEISRAPAETGADRPHRPDRPGDQPPEAKPPSIPVERRGDGDAAGADGVASRPGAACVPPGTQRDGRDGAPASSGDADEEVI